jgi:hypothetical protein
MANNSFNTASSGGTPASCILPVVLGGKNDNQKFVCPFTGISHLGTESYSTRVLAS